jgi:hypothetical protein
MENERSHLAPKLRRAEQLQGEVDSLSRELQILGELYQQQREEAQDLVRHSQREQELMVLCVSMKKEKEASQKVIASLTQQLRIGVARGEELETVVSRKEGEIASLQQKLVLSQGKYQAKMKVSGEIEGEIGGGGGFVYNTWIVHYCAMIRTPIHKKLHVSLTFGSKHKFT